MTDAVGLQRYTYRGEIVRAAPIVGWRLVLGLDDGSNVHVGSDLHGGSGGPDLGDILVCRENGTHQIVKAGEFDGVLAPEPVPPAPEETVASAPGLVLIEGGSEHPGDPPVVT